MNWSVLERLHGLAAVPAVWRKYLGEDFEQFKILCLQPAPRPALSFPCPLATSCAYRITPDPAARSDSPTLRHSDSSFLGHCQRNPVKCEHISLTLEDITPLELSWPKLAHAISIALSLNSRFSKFSVPQTIQVGTWSADAVPVILTIQTEPSHFRQVITELIARLRQRFILFAPTSQFFDALSQELIANANAGLFALDTTVTLTPNGNLQSVKTPGDLLAKFLPEEKLPEDPALRAFAVLKSMDTDQPIRKAPVFTVFRLYCMENLSVEQVAKKLNCTKPTIISRLRLIRKKTGTSPANLRAYSAQFTRIEQSLSGDRSKRIRREENSPCDPSPD